MSFQWQRARHSKKNTPPKRRHRQQTTRLGRIHGRTKIPVRSAGSLETYVLPFHPLLTKPICWNYSMKLAKIIFTQKLFIAFNLILQELRVNAFAASEITRRATICNSP